MYRSLAYLCFFVAALSGVRAEEEAPSAKALTEDNFKVRQLVVFLITSIFAYYRNPLFLSPYLFITQRKLVYLSLYFLGYDIVNM